MGRGKSRLSRGIPGKLVVELFLATEKKIQSNVYMLTTHLTNVPDETRCLDCCFVALFCMNVQTSTSGVSRISPSDDDLNPMQRSNHKNSDFLCTDLV